MNADPRTTYAAAVDALNKQAWPKAWQLASSLFDVAPEHAGVQFVAGVASLQQGNMAQAHRHLGRAARLNPKRPDYVAQWARLLAMSHAIQDAVTVTLDAIGVVFTQANEHAKAVDVFRRAVRIAPHHAGLHFNLATSATFNGNMSEAESAYESCISLQPDYWKAHLGLAQLRRQTSEHNHLPRLHSLLHDAGTDRSAKLYLNLALEKEYADLGNIDASFEALTVGKAAWRETLPNEPTRDERLFQAIEDSVASIHHPATGSGSARPIFIMGMPRTGTTLVDRILSSHSQVMSAGELQNFGVLCKRASGSRTSPILDEDTVSRVANVDWHALGEAYLRSTQLQTGAAARFIDKLPHNFLYAGFIAQALPNAAMICLRRDPIDTCLSNFRQLFALSSPYYDYSFDLLDTARYVVLFDRIMSHWRAVMPGRILEIAYEDIVNDQLGCTRRLLEHCALPWEDACLRFQDNVAPVSTASAVQVRAPLYSSSIGRWKQYGNRLDPARAILADAGLVGAD
ncbi:sulfotransferase family protein [Luteimonas rhizosphaerae]|uniref:sulfotransferase family protein n=1 Tax=Luteimonas sp. 4-12 TaxID=2027406 RepID=UPI001E527961|nr:sulfotransferase [Luteimonas sp. 4-12]